MLSKFRKSLMPFCHSPFLNIPKISFKNEEFIKFLSEKYQFKNPPVVLFGVAPFRSMVGSFNHRKNEIILFWPGIIVKTLAQKYPNFLASNDLEFSGLTDSLKFYLALFLAHETKHFLQNRRFLGHFWLILNYFFLFFVFIMTGFGLFAANSSFYLLSIIIWLAIFVGLYWILPCEISARRFAKKQMKENRDWWMSFFEISD